jgi:hypothetical protein
MENGPFIDGLPIKNGDFLVSYVKLPEGNNYGWFNVRFSPSGVVLHFCYTQTYPDNMQTYPLCLTKPLWVYLGII